jgi:glycine cleavage system aminomethyltransferase T/glycine/D-amino acid oxidase-like deaminating enzyme
MQMHARVVIIGAGIVGCSTAYYLTQMGWREIVVLEQGPLGQNWGSTSHAPGMMFQHNVSKSVCQMAQWSADLYARVQTPEQAFWRTGSMEIASTPERWEELKRRLGQAMSWGLDASLISAAEAGKRVPILRTDDLFGAFFVPGDCVVNAAAIASGLAAEASERGATFHAHAPVTGIEVENGRVRAVVTPQGRIATEIVISAAGIWGPLIGKLAGVPIPLTPMQHIFARTNPLPELADERAILRHPIVRHQDKDLYFRQYGSAYGFGSYRHDPLPVDADALKDDGHPAILPYTPEHLAVSLEDAYARMPVLRAAGLAHTFNGLFSFTPDGFSLLGESPDVRGFWSAEAVWITHAGGVGRAMAEWIVDGVPSIDLRESDLNRFHRHTLNRDYIRIRANQQYVEVYDVIHPLDQTMAPRGLRLSPFHARQCELGAHFFESAGWERPQWYAANADELAARGMSWPERTEWTARNWSPIVGAEHLATRERVALFDLTPFTKLEVSGPGALGWLQWLAANQMDQPIGKVTYTAMLTAQGGIRCDLTVTRLAADRCMLVTGGASGAHDLAWLRQQLPDDGSVAIRDRSSGQCCIGLWGPRAHDLVAKVSEDDFAFPSFTARQVTIGHVPVLAARVSYVGEPGWELYAPTEYGSALWDTLWEAGRSLGVIAAGGGAFESLRLEKGYRLWGADIHTEYNPFEAGTGFAVRLNKGDFQGRTALVRTKEASITRKLCCLTLDDPRVVLMGKEPILDGERVLGYVTSANYGYSVGKSIAYGYVPVAYATPGTSVTVQFFGVRHAATVTREPLYAPENVRPYQ